MDSKFNTVKSTYIIGNDRTDSVLKNNPGVIGITSGGIITATGGVAIARPLYTQCNKLTVYKTVPDAVLPFKTHDTDAGYDLTVLNKYKDLDSQTALYDTGIKIDLPKGYYGLVYPRSSLSKSGYMLANSVGVIDNGYHGNIYIALRKVNPEAEEICFPFRCCQLILVPQPIVQVEETTIDFSQQNQTDRNTGGFGSTG